MASTYTVQVIPDASGWSAKLEAQIDPVTRRIAEQLKNRLQRAMREGLSGGGTTVRTQGSRTGQQFGDAFSRTAKSRIEAALRSLPTVQIGVATTQAEQHLRDLSARLKTLGEDIDLGVDDKKALAEIDNLQRELRRLARESPDVRVRVNTGTALAELEALKKSIDGFDRKGRFTRWLDDLRDKSPIIDSAVSKLGNLSDIAGKAQPFLLPYAIVSALSLIGPLAGAATGALIGLAGVAGVAALAFVGIRQALADNVGYGAAISKQFSLVGQVIQGLGRVAAASFLPVLDRIGQQLRQLLPNLAPLVAGVAGKLSSSLGHIADGLLLALQRSEPLINDFAGYIEKLSVKFANFTASQQFQDFLNYARKELPKVGDAVASLTKGVISLAQSLSTLGDNTLASLKGLGDLVGLIGKIGSAKVVPGAPKGGLLDQLGLTSIGGIAGNTLNPFGAILKGIDVFQSQGDARKQAIADAEAKVRAGRDAAAAQAAAAYAASSDGLARVLGTTNGAYAAATESAKANAAQLAQTTLEMQAQGDAAGLLKAALDSLSGKNLSVAQSLNAFQSGLLGVDDQFTKAAFSSTAFNEANVQQRNTLQTLVTAAQAHAQAVADQTQSTAQGTATLKADYDQIVANTGATGAQKQAILDYIQSIGGIPAVKPTVIEVKKDAAEAAVASFHSLYDRLGPKTVTINADVSNAVASISRFVNTPRSAYVQVFTTVAGQAPSGGRQAINAYGGIITPYARGGINPPRFAQGIENHIPQIAKPNGLFRVWAEPETKGEAYIPFAMDRRARAEDIVGSVAKRFGGSYIPASSLKGMASGGAARSGPVNISGTVAVDLPGVGLLNGHIVGIADSRIGAAAASTSHAAGAGSSSPVH